jgi:hypothetical protein
MTSPLQAEVFRIVLLPSILAAGHQCPKNPFSQINKNFNP